MAGRLIAVDFACNDPANGLFGGRVAAAEIDGNEIERWPDVRFAELAGGFRIHRKHFAVQDRTEWFGNWCWNRFWMTAREANRLIDHLRANGWHCTCGEQRFYERFNAQGMSLRENSRSEVEAEGCQPGQPEADAPQNPSQQRTGSGTTAPVES